MTHTANIRNFCIIAHIDHGKSTLADRLMERTQTISKREMRDQALDSMDLERERGITIKAHPVRMNYTARDGQAYVMNLIDTPGHVDFTYEVSRSIASCEGALLLIDASQGIEAQTMANLHLALEHNLEIIPVVNKIDLPNADLETVTRQITELIGLPESDILLASAKQGTGIEEILERIVAAVPPPKDPADDFLRALVFDSVYNTYRGVVLHVRVFSGSIRATDRIKLFKTGLEYEVGEVGVFCPKPAAKPTLDVGEVGYIIANIKQSSEVKTGDTVTRADNPTPEPLPGFKEVRPMVFSGLYPTDTADYPLLRDAIEKLQLNDSSITFQAESSAALGFGFRCGFLGLLHMEIIQERLQREFNTNIIMTTPNVAFRVKLTSGETVVIDNPAQFPTPAEIDEIEEPYVRAFIMAPNDTLGAIMQLALDKRGECKHTETLGAGRMLLTFELPLNEIVIDFHDKLKSCTRGYGSLDYEPFGMRKADMVKLDILVNGEPVDAFSSIVHRDKAYQRGRQMAEKLKDVIPPHLFSIPIQATIGGKIIARETVKAVGKNVTAKCYGGDITRKRKLWEKQKEGKKRMRQFGTVNIPQTAFIEVLKI